MKKSFFSHGKLLLSGEYLVLDGALALAIPTQKGQEMTVEMFPGSGNIHWTAKDVNGAVWLNISFILAEGELIPITVGNLNIPNEVLVLKRIFESALRLKSNFLTSQNDYEIMTHLQFAGNWGLGSSSTLIANIAKWAEVDALKLFFNSFEGSGYDVAVAMTEKPIIYQMQNQSSIWEVVDFNPSFTNELFFIHLGQKQDSRKEIVNYKAKAKPTLALIEKINDLTLQLSKCNELEIFEKLITEHEKIIAEILETEPIKQRLFLDYPGAIKSLGAWGGDFILATGQEAKTYFREKGYDTVLSWDEMVKS